MVLVHCYFCSGFCLAKFLLIYMAEFVQDLLAEFVRNFTAEFVRIFKAEFVWTLQPNLYGFFS